MNNDNDTRVEIRLPSSLLAKIDEMRDGRSRSEVIRRILSCEIERREKMDTFHCSLDRRMR